MIDPKVCTKEGDIRPRRGNLPVRVSEFFSSLTRTPDGRWIFSGVLNGWPGLTCLELRSLTQRRRTKMGQKKIEYIWDAKNNPDCMAPPHLPGSEEARATMH